MTARSSRRTVPPTPHSSAWVRLPLLLLLCTLLIGAANAQDCNGDIGGTAFIDDCGTCVGGNTGEAPCIADCNGDFGGTAFIDGCGNCVEGNTLQPAAVEICNDGIDNDCDGLVDEDDPDAIPIKWYPDLDGDGYGAGYEVMSCAAPAPGYVVNNLDCNDGDATIYPGNGCLEGGVCTSAHAGWIDQEQVYYHNLAVSAFVSALYDSGGNIPTALNTTRDALEGNFSDEYLYVAPQCHDCALERLEALAPGCVFLCNLQPENCYACLQDWGPAFTACVGLTDIDQDGWAAGSDCDDNNASINPGAVDVCDGVDNNCNGIIDEDGDIWYLDNDGDGFGINGVTVVSCTQPPGYAAQGGDCDDSNADVNPGVPEICGDGIDNNCDGAIDEEFPWYLDSDGDGYGDIATEVYACEQPPNHVLWYGDCDDTDPNIHPDAPEVCDGIDNDCNGLVDEGFTTLWYPDNDGDGYGDAAGELISCTQPPGYVADATDCDDNDPDVFPGQGCSICLLAEVAWIDQNQHSYLSAFILAWVEDQVFAPGYIDIFMSEGQLSGLIPLSTECHQCAFELVNCVGLSNCLTQCIPGGEPCTQCFFDNTACMQQFIQCATLTDTDGDGWAAGSDCDDNNASINPGVPEVCDGIDNNCNGQVDEGFTTLWYPDNDGDGYGDAAGELISCTQPPGHVADATDCDDNDPDVFPGQGCGNCPPAGLDWIAANQQAYLQLVIDTHVECILAGGSSGSLEDCVLNALIDQGIPVAPDCHSCAMAYFDCVNFACLVACITDPSWPECASCQFNNQCLSGFISCMGLTDADGDGWAAPSDCDDNDPTVHPGAVDGCDGIDNNCNGIIDEDGDIWYLDNDGDGFGINGVTAVSCTQPPGYAAQGGDCDDSNASVYPGAPEICDDGVDNNCNGQIDEEIPWYLDSDGDGYGVWESEVYACEQPPNHVLEGGDCDDTDPNVHPDAPELCDGVDNNCNGQIDEGFTTLWYPDNDGDGFGDLAGQLYSCTQPPGYVASGNDCDDNDPDLFPGQGCGTCPPAGLDWIAANQQAYLQLVLDSYTNCITSGASGTINDCVLGALNGLAGQGIPVAPECHGCAMEYLSCALDACLLPCALDPDGPACASCHFNTQCLSGFLTCMGITDADGDGWAAPSDCDDNDPTVHPGAVDGCDGIDNNCNGIIDEDGDIWYLDNDGDGFGINGVTAVSCTQPFGYVAQGGDCDDNNASVYPGAPEICDDGVDNNCNGQIDEEIPWYLDSDGDGYGVWESEVYACEQPPNHVLEGGDCDDTDPNIYPDAPELCDGVDNNCNGQIDEGFTTLWYPDNDGDGFGDLAGQLYSCTQPPGYVASGNDCDDNDPDLFPGQGCGTCPPAGLDWIAANQQAYLQLVLDSYTNCITSGASGTINDCVLGALNGLAGQGIPVAPECHGCAMEYLSCALDACLLPCVTDPDGPACASCHFNTQCLSGFLTCMGLADADGDGWAVPSDCDDNNPAVYPGALEFCDGIDNDCNGVIDDNCIPPDCNGVFGGTAFIDNCGFCVGGDTGLPPCNSDLLVITPPTATPILLGQTLANSQLLNGVATDPGSGNPVAGVFTFDVPSTAPPLGTAVQPVTFTPVNLALDPVAMLIAVTVNNTSVPVRIGLVHVPHPGGDSLEVRLLPLADFSGPVSLLQFALRWDNAAVTVPGGARFVSPQVAHYIKGSTNTSANALSGQYSNAGIQYRQFYFENIDILAAAAQWTAGVEVPLMRIAYDAAAFCVVFDLEQDPFMGDGIAFPAGVDLRYSITLGLPGSMLVDQHDGTYGDAVVLPDLQADAGVDQVQCDLPLFNMEASAAAGNGTWSLISGQASITDPGDPLTTISGVAGTVVLEWSVSNGVCPAQIDQVTLLNQVPGAPCDDGDPTTTNDIYVLDNGTCSCQGTIFLAVMPTVLLDGPYIEAQDLMRDDLRMLGLLPLAQPYSAMPFAYPGSETIDPALLATTGPQAIVDWVLLELRDRIVPSTVVARRAALLRRDGSVVDTDGSGPVLFIGLAPNEYHLAIRHRNHLGVMSATPIALSHLPVAPDFSSNTFANYGANPTLAASAQKTRAGRRMLWAGNTNPDTVLKYTGPANDRDPILVDLPNVFPTSVRVNVYFQTDINLDGLVKYTGADNDRDPILDNIGGSVPTAVRLQQLP